MSLSQGSQFASYVSKMDPRQREQAIRDEILKGNLPQFLRKLVPVKLLSGTAGRQASYCHNFCDA